MGLRAWRVAAIVAAGFVLGLGWNAWSGRGIDLRANAFILPGEKLHEVMISVDDAYITVDLGSRYAIEPAFDDFARKSLKDTMGATSVPDRFSYSSDTNPDVLDDNGLRRLLAEAGY